VKVLIIHQHFRTPYQGGAIRSYYLAQALISSGIKVEVITAHDGAPRNELVDDISVTYLKVPYKNSFGFFKRSIAFLNFMWKAVNATKNLRGIDLCYAISVPLTVGVAAQKIEKRYKIPFVFEVGDLWPDAPIQMGFVRNIFLKKFLYSMERRIYQSAKSIVALSPAIKEAIQKKLAEKKVHLVPNMSDTNFFDKSSKDVELQKKYNVLGKFVVSYIGALGVANGLNYLIDCAEASRKSGLSIHFIFCGDGALKNDIRDKVQRLELENVTVMDLLDRNGVKEVFNVTDAAFISYKPVKILETGSPNKFFDALAAGKLIIINFGGWIKTEIEENDCGVFVDPLQTRDFIKKVRPFLDDPLLLENYQYNARSLAEKKYSRRELSSRFSNLISDSLEN